MASSKVARRRQGSLGLPKDSPPPPTVNGAASPSQSLDNLEMIKTIGNHASILLLFLEGTSFLFFFTMSMGTGSIGLGRLMLEVDQEMARLSLSGPSKLFLVVTNLISPRI